MKEDYENVKFLLESINYSRYNWLLRKDFQMIEFLKGLPEGYTKHFYFFLWDSQAVTKHFSRKEWPEWRFFISGSQNVQHDPLVESEQILMPFLYVKLRLVKQFVKTINKDKNCFQHICVMFPFLFGAKKAGILLSHKFDLCFSAKDLKTR